MKILHVVKTSEGAQWAASQAKFLTKKGVDIHVVLPSREGEAIKYWKDANATIHYLDFSLPITNFFSFLNRKKVIQQFVDKLKPDIIHSHFVTTTIMLRLSLYKYTSIPILFQVPGPLHLEYAFFRFLEILTASKNDYWICSSKYIKSIYLKSKIPESKLYLSYYGTTIPPLLHTVTTLLPRYMNNSIKFGNINYMYPPKKFLMQLKGLKRHEDIIDAVKIVSPKILDFFVIFVGGQWGKGTEYESKLRHLANTTSDKIYFAGKFLSSDAPKLWSEIDCAIHVPISENCGGVVEPLLYNTPVIASRVGGIPEVIINGYTGYLVPKNNPKYLANTIHEVSNNMSEAKQRASLGQKLASEMFDINRTGNEIYSIYCHVLKISNEKPPEFNSLEYVKKISSKSESSLTYN